MQSNHYTAGHNKARPGRPISRNSDVVGNRTLTTGLDLLQKIARLPEPATITEISRYTGMSITRVSRYVGSLTQSGFLQQDPSTGRFDLGSAVIELGISALGRMDAVKIASELMRPLTEATGMVSILCVWGSNGPTVIRWEQGRLDLAIRIREGLNLSVVITAAGRVFLAYHEPDELKKILQRDLRAWNAGAPPGERLTMSGIDALRQEVMKNGIAAAAGLRNPSLAAISAPIFGQGGRLLMSLTLAGIINSFDLSCEGEPAKELKATAQKLSRMLGGGPTTT